MNDATTNVIETPAATNAPSPTTDAKARIRKIKAAAAKIREAKGEPKETRKIADKSAKEIKHEVQILLDELRSAKTTDDKKRIRRALRARGHVGGLGGRKGYVVEKAASKKGRRAKREQVVGDTTTNDAVAA
jgi:hypothetical protein